MSAGIAGGVIAFYRIGYGIAAFGVGPLLSSGRTLSEIYGLTAVVAGALARVVVPRRAGAALRGSGPAAVRAAGTRATCLAGGCYRRGRSSVCCTSLPATRICRASTRA